MAETTADPILFSAGPAQLRRSPLEHLAPALATTEHSLGVALREIPFTTQIGLRAAPGSSAHEALAEATGVGLPMRASEVAGDPGSVAVLWLGPDEFLVIGPEDGQPLLEDLSRGLGDLPGQVVDLSANRTIIAVEGEQARDLLEQGVPVDLHPRSFGPGQAVTTLLGPAPVLLWQTAEQSYRVLPRASFADYTARWLLDAAREYHR